MGWHAEQVYRLRMWLTDGQYEGRWQEAWWRERLQQAGVWALCRVYGHHPTRDHCNKPEHDYCLWCLRRMPGEALDRVSR